MNRRIGYLDTLRWIACFLVILVHSAISASDPSDGIYYAFISLLGPPSNGLFFAISGALLLPTTLAMGEFYKRRFPRLVFPLIFWTLFSILFYQVSGKHTADQSITMLLKSPFCASSNGVYWFLYVLVGLYFYIPILSKWLIDASKKEVEFYLLLWAITLILPLINYICPGFYNPAGSFYQFISIFGGFMGYLLLGHYCVKYPITIKAKAKAVLLFAIIQIGIFSAYFSGKFLFDDMSILSDNLTILTALQVFVIFNFIANINNSFVKIQPIISNTSKYLFGVYLIHIFIIRDLVWLIFENNRLQPIIETFLVAIISMGLSLLITHLISKLPKSKYIIGI